MASQDGARAAFAENISKLIEDYDFDGIDLDWEVSFHQSCNI
jgi:GH18 family chitinase